MIKIFVLTANVWDGCAISRIHSVKHLEETGYPVCVQMGIEITNHDIKWADIVLIHGPCYANSIAVAKEVKAQCKKLWVDNYDDQLTLDIDHPAYLYYLNENIKTNIRECTKMADLVTVSNVNILTSYAGFNANSHVYPCSYDERLMPAPEYTPRNKTVLWRGTSTHRKSCAEFADAIGSVDKDHEGWRFVFVGDYPWQILEKITRNNWYVESNYMPTQKMWHYTRNLKPAIQMVLLHDTQFIKSRSAMAVMDGAIAGARTLARDWEHFDIPGVATYEDKEDFASRLSSLMTDIEAGISFAGDVENSWKYIQSNFTFKAVNKLQYWLIKELMEKHG